MEEKQSNVFWIGLIVILVIGASAVFYWGTHHQTNAEKLQSATQKADQSKKNLDAATKKYEDAKTKADQ